MLRLPNLMAKVIKYIIRVWCFILHFFKQSIHTNLDHQVNNIVLTFTTELAIGTKANIIKIIKTNSHLGCITLVFGNRKLDVS
ncbi:hypothetical protein TA05_08085 [Citrobacter rodentium]|nr:hypothetical protein TA05_08085 [Citrobacter rodentium]